MISARSKKFQSWEGGSELCVNVPQLFKDLGYLNPADVKQRVPFQFVPPVEVVQPAAAPKPKPKAAPKQLSMASFLKKN